MSLSFLLNSPISHILISCLPDLNVFFLLTALLRYNLHSIKIILHPKVYNSMNLQLCTNITTTELLKPHGHLYTYFSFLFPAQGKHFLTLQAIDPDS